MAVLGAELYTLWLEPYEVLRLLAKLWAVGEGRAWALLGKEEVVADLGAVLRPARRWERLVRGVGAPLS
jgi:hypothetical protein